MSLEREKARLEAGEVGLKTEVTGLRAEVATLEASMVGLREELGQRHTQLETLRSELIFPAVHTTYVCVYAGFFLISQMWVCPKWVSSV